MRTGQGARGRATAAGVVAQPARTSSATPSATSSGATPRLTHVSLLDGPRTTCSPRRKPTPRVPRRSLPRAAESTALSRRYSRSGLSPGSLRLAASGMSGRSPEIRRNRRELLFQLVRIIRSAEEHVVPPAATSGHPRGPARRARSGRRYGRSAGARSGALQIGRLTLRALTPVQSVRHDRHPACTCLAVGYPEARKRSNTPPKIMEVSWIIWLSGWVRDRTSISRCEAVQCRDCDYGAP